MERSGKPERNRAFTRSRFAQTHPEVFRGSGVLLAAASAPDALAVGNGGAVSSAPGATFTQLPLFVTDTPSAAGSDELDELEAVSVSLSSRGGAAELAVDADGKPGGILGELSGSIGGGTELVASDAVESTVTTFVSVGVESTDGPLEMLDVRRAGGRLTIISVVSESRAKGEMVTGNSFPSLSTIVYEPRIVPRGDPISTDDR